MSATNISAAELLIIGIGNVLMGDEGIGPKAASLLAARQLPPGIKCVDGGTGGLHLLEFFENARAVILIDACLDDSPPGAVRRLEPKFSSDYPRSLSAHDIGLKDLLDALQLRGRIPPVILYAVSIKMPDDLSLELSEPVAAAVPELLERVQREAEAMLAQKPA